MMTERGKESFFEKRNGVRHTQQEETFKGHQDLLENLKFSRSIILRLIWRISLRQEIDKERKTTAETPFISFMYLDYTLTIHYLTDEWLYFSSNSNRMLDHQATAKNWQMQAIRN